MLVDTHCHLDFEQFDPDREAVLARAREAGVTRIIIPGVDLAACRRAVALAEREPEVYAAVGIHPNSIEDLTPAGWVELRELVKHPKVVGIGEIGIDLYWRKMSLTDQEAAFRAQVRLADEAGKPVIVHDRDAHAEVMAVLQDLRPARGGVLHAFSGDQRMAEAALELGWYLGVDGPVTYKKNDALRAVFAAAPLERVLVETDAPYLTPQPRRGQRNEPAYVRWVVEKVAELRGISMTAAAAATTRNAARLFGWES
ncbi:MAG: TatD family hydrolase, partial [Anaerolineales bacterium]|nr:TatD family hydrolase [Anaerolineales bacterium]